MLYKSLFGLMSIALFAIFANSAQAQEIRVLTYNIHHGEDVNGKLDLQQIARVINSARPDVIALQEVDSLTGRSQKTDQLKELAALSGMNYFYGKSLDYDGGGYGVGILSKYPITNKFVTRLPGLPKSEPRVAATVELQLENNKRFLFSAVHLDHVKDPAERMEQAKKLREVHAALDLPSILAGDFNAGPSEATMKDIIFSSYDETDPTGHSLSFPSGKPDIKIDYVLVSKKHSWEKISYEVLDEKIASDHRPVLSVVRLR